jgi:hypothetical protein
MGWTDQGRREKACMLRYHGVFDMKHDARRSRPPPRTSDPAKTIAPQIPKQRAP